MDERKLAAALARFGGFQKNRPTRIKENIIEEYHSIVNDIAAVTDDNLDVFKITADELKPIIISVQRAPYGGGSGHTNYSEDKYCDPERFCRQLDALDEYLKSTGHRRDQTPRQDILRSRGSSGPTYNIENMVGSAIQHDTRDSHLTVTYDTKGPEFKAVIDQIRSAIPKLELEPDEKNQIYTDIGTIEVQVHAPVPKRSIITESMHSIRNILEGMVGSALASDLLSVLSTYLPK